MSDAERVRYVITPEVAVLLIEADRPFAPGDQLVAPTLLRSQVLSLLHGRVQRGELAADAARAVLDGVRGLGIRLLGDRVLQEHAWRIADELGSDDTFGAEYVALTRLQADALVTTDPALAAAAASFVDVAPLDRLTG